jgi:hypothetical protein
MPPAENLFELLKKAPKDKDGVLQPSPETSAFKSALAATKPLTPPELLAMAKSRRADPKRASTAEFFAFQALSAIAHDKQCLRALSKIGKEATPWGLNIDDLFHQILAAYHAPAGASAPHNFPIGTGGQTGGSTGWSISGCTFEGVTCPEGKSLTYPIPPNLQTAASYLGASALSGYCLNGRLHLNYID